MVTPFLGVVAELRIVGDMGKGGRKRRKRGVHYGLLTPNLESGVNVGLENLTKLILMENVKKE